MGHNYSYITYNPTYNYPRTSKYLTSAAPSHASQLSGSTRKPKAHETQPYLELIWVVIRAPLRVPVKGSIGIL